MLRGFAEGLAGRKLFLVFGGRLGQLSVAGGRGSL